MSSPKLSATPEHKLGEREMIAMMAMLMSLQAFGIDSMLPALGIMSDELGASGNDRQYVIGAYFLGSGIGAFLPGAFADRFGRRPVLFFGLFSYVVLSLACAWISDFGVLIAIRLIQGIACAGLSVVPTAIVRDHVGGDRMARLMSLIIMIFLAVPIVAPAIGQVILIFAGWRMIFVLMAVAAVIVGLWMWRRLPESLLKENVQQIEPRVILRNMGHSLANRVSLGYALGSALIFGSLFGFLNSSQQLIGESFGAGDYFAVIFGGSVLGMVVSSFLNARIVERFGARRVSHSALFGFLGVSLAQLYFAQSGSQTLWSFIPLLSFSMAMLGFVGANFSSIAMQPYAAIAGAASSAQTSLRLVTSAIVGAVIGQAYDGSAVPLAFAMVMCALASLGLVLFGERGKLFRRPSQARRYMIMHDIMRG
ncbi:MAG: multidrug effflux MFS transporter [Erythrobacter sp.]